MAKQSRTLSYEDARRLAETLCRERGWSFIEPLTITAHLLSWTITTNAGRMGCNARIRVNRRSGEITHAAYSPR
jgi:hypothetical protein